MIRSNSETEQAWIDAWNDLSDLIADITRYEIVLPNLERVDVATCQGWLQETVYRGNAVALARYIRKDNRYQIHVMHWPLGATQPSWVSRTVDGFYLEEF